MNHDEARARAANEAFPPDGKGTWTPTQRPAVIVIPVREEKWSVQKCADMLGVEPFEDGDNWRDYAECKGTHVDLFFPERGDGNAQALTTCMRCPVRAECLAFSLNEVEAIGVWGGLSELQRRNIRSGRGYFVYGPDGERREMLPATEAFKRRPPAPCGTARGYDHHKRVGETPCAACLSAHSREANEYRKAKKRRERTQ